MEKNEFCLYLSQKDGKEAARDISLKIKSIFRHKLNFIFLLFTPDYQPQELLETFNLTLRAATLLGVKSPLLIYKDKIIKKGVIGCCINKEGSKFENFFVGEKESEKIEHKFRMEFKKPRKQGTNFISFLSPQVNPLSFLQGLRLSLGKLADFSSAGYTDKNYSIDYFMLNEGMGSGLVNLSIEGMGMQSIRLHNFIPLGKPFNITKFNFQQQIIHEINNKPAVEIYKHYLEEKFTELFKNRLFRYYPLGIPMGDSFRLLTVTDILEDGSFLLKGNLRYKTGANMMLLKENCSKALLTDKLQKVNTGEKGLAFVINSLPRKKILGEKAEEEIKYINEILSPDKEVFGAFCDYYLFSDYKTQDTNIETGGLLLNVLE